MFSVSSHSTHADTRTRPHRLLRPVSTLARQRVPHPRMAIIQPSQALLLGILTAVPRRPAARWPEVG